VPNPAAPTTHKQIPPIASAVGLQNVNTNIAAFVVTPAEAVATAAASAEAAPVIIATLAASKYTKLHKPIVTAPTPAEVLPTPNDTFYKVKSLSYSSFKFYAYPF
jgi:hypothetical protein